MIETSGCVDFSLRNLAAALGVTVSSLYNHINGQEELLSAVGLRAVELLILEEELAISGKNPEPALYALADAYRQFALEHTALYQIIMGIPLRSDTVLKAAAERLAEPVLQVLSSLGLQNEAQVHYQRVLRSIMHGFIFHETGGGFLRSEFDREVSYQLAVRCIISDIRQIKGNSAHVQNCHMR